MLDKIKWLGHDTFQIKDEKVIYIDPWQLEGTEEQADIILITHDHYDHCVPEDVAKIQGQKTVIVTTADCAQKLSGDVRVIAPGDNMVIDGVESPRYDDITSGIPLFGPFSPNSQRMAYSARLGDKEFALIDGLKGKAYDAVSLPAFSPDSQHVAYIAKEGGKAFIVIDGEEGKHYNEVSLPLFSADSQRIAYIAKDADGQFVVVDGREGERYELVLTQVFSPDSQHLAFMAKFGLQQFVVIGDVEGPAYSTSLTRVDIVWDSPNSLHHLGIKGNGVYLVQIEDIM